MHRSDAVPDENPARRADRRGSAHRRILTQYKVLDFSGGSA
jgi:hypothetical protein